MPESLDSIARRLEAILLADLCDEQPTLGSLRIARSTLRLIRRTCRDKGARKLARQTLTVLKERDKQAAVTTTIKDFGPSPRTVNGHVLLRPGECRHLHRSNGHGDRLSCRVCDGGLGICSLCGAAEIELDGPCEPKPEWWTPPAKDENPFADLSPPGSNYYSPVNDSNGAGDSLGDNNESPKWSKVHCTCDGVNPECGYCQTFLDPSSPDLCDQDGMLSPIYRSAADRDLAAVEHAVAVLAEAIHLREPCGCMPQRECEACRILDHFRHGLAEAREFLAGPESDGVA